MLNGLGRVLVACLVSLAVWAVMSSGARGAQPPAFRAGVELVRLDVSVLDKDRQPVRGLTADDFTLLDDGKPVPIATVAPVELADPDPAAAAWTRDVGPDVVSNQFDAQRVVVIFIDDFNTHAVLGPTTRRIAQAAVDRLGPADVASVVYVHNHNKGQEFTTDKARLRQSIDQFAANGLFFGGGACMYDDCVIQAFRNAAKSLLSMSGRRKSLIYITSMGFFGKPPFDFSQTSLQDRSKWNEALQIFDDLRRANVNVYTFDTGGTPGPLLSILERFKDLSESTGGWTVTSDNEPWTRVADVFSENGSYYVLGFASSHPLTDTHLHALTVKVNRPGVEVHARSGYFAAPPLGPPKPSATKEPPTVLQAAISGAVPRGDLPLSLAAVPVASAGRAGNAVAIVAGLDGPLAGGTIDIMTTAFDDDWKLAGEDQHRLVLARASTSAGAHYDLMSRVNVKPGRYEVRVGVTETGSGRTGSAYASVTVPDFTRESLSASGVLLERKPPMADTPQGSIADVVPMRPTTKRVFAATDRVTAFVRVYEGGSKPIVPVAITMRVLNGAGREVSVRSTTLPVDRFRADRSVDDLEDVPTANLEPGEYLLTFDVGDGKVHPHRDVRFTVSREP